MMKERRRKKQLDKIIGHWNCLDFLGRLDCMENECFILMAKLLDKEMPEYMDKYIRNNKKK